MLLDVESWLVGEEDSQITVRFISRRQTIDASGGGVINDLGTTPVSTVVSALQPLDSSIDGVCPEDRDQN